jgi:hypothetical protein
LRNPTRSDRLVFRKREKRKVYELVSIRVNTGTDITPEATVKVKYKHKILEAKSEGDGPVDACFKAVDKIMVNLNSIDFISLRFMAILPFT